MSVPSQPDDLREEQQPIRAAACERCYFARRSCCARSGLALSLSLALSYRHAVAKATGGFPKIGLGPDPLAERHHGQTLGISSSVGFSASPSAQRCLCSDLFATPAQFYTARTHVGSFCNNSTTRCRKRGAGNFHRLALLLPESGPDWPTCLL